MKLKKYKVVSCEKCHNIQITGGKTLKCKFCHRYTKIKQKNRFGLSVKLIKDFDDEKTASRFIIALKNEIINNKNFIGFKSFTMRNSEEYLVGKCGRCEQDIMSNIEWEMSAGRPAHKECPKKKSAFSHLEEEIN